MAAQEPCAEVRRTTDKGRGYFATRGLEAGELVLHEAPFLSMQLPANEAAGVRACGHCLRLVGTMDMQLQHAAGWAKPPILPLDAEDMDLGGCVECEGGCGTFFCGQRCAQLAWQQQHKLLCAGSAVARRRRALAQFEAHARANHEAFLPAARAVALVLCAFDTNGGDLQSALALLAPLCGKEWWRRRAGLGAPSSVVPQGRRELADWSASAESLRLLLLALPEHPALKLGATRGSPPWLDHAFYSQLVGKLRLNAVCVDIHNPVRDFIAALCAASDIHAARAAEGALGRSHQYAEVDRLLQDVAARQTIVGCPQGETSSSDDASSSDDISDSASGSMSDSASDDSDDDNEKWSAAAMDEVPNVVGTALCSTVACCNHSCEPNIEVRFEGCHEVQLWTTRAVAVGEELHISYIENECLSLAQRRRALREYGFVCACAKCKREAASSS